MLKVKLCTSVVFRPSEAVQHASQASARLHLPSSRPTKEGAPLHHRPAQLFGPPLGHQDVQGRHCLPHDGIGSVFKCSPCTICAHIWPDDITLLHQVLALVFIRKLLDFIFTKRELSWLDDLMPEWKKKKLEDAQQEVQQFPHSVFQNIMNSHLCSNKTSISVVFSDDLFLLSFFRRSTALLLRKKALYRCLWRET